MSYIRTKICRSDFCKKEIGIEDNYCRYCGHKYDGRNDSSLNIWYRQFGGRQDIQLPKHERILIIQLLQIFVKDLEERKAISGNEPEERREIGWDLSGAQALLNRFLDTLNPKDVKRILQDDD